MFGYHTILQALSVAADCPQQHIPGEVLGVLYLDHPRAFIRIKRQIGSSPAVFPIATPELGLQEPVSTRLMAGVHELIPLVS
jgi:hypothetical protein